MNQFFGFSIASAPAAGSRQRRCGRFRQAFTLVEMVVVVAVVILLVTLALPAANTLWNQRVAADAENILQGVLKNARARATSAGGRETGLFFFLGFDGRQRIAPIQQTDPGNVLYANVFSFLDEADEVLPAPMRVVPRYAADDDAAPGVDRAFVFSNEELINENTQVAVNTTIDVSQRHRNVFAVVFGRDGQLIAWRDVFIQDTLSEALQSPTGARGLGDRTRLNLSENGNGCREDPDREGSLLCMVARQYYRQGTVTPPQWDIDPTGNHRMVPNLITNLGGSSSTAINFPSVDGLLLYDDKSYRSLVSGGADAREFLHMNAQPFYVSRTTGQVVLGPVGEHSHESGVAHP